jgi:hypothetical protein
MYKTNPMASAEKGQGRREQTLSGSGAVSVLRDTSEMASIGIVDSIRKPAEGQAPKEISGPTQSEGRNGGHETISFTPFSDPTEVVLLGTAIYLLNKEETPPGIISRANRLGVRLDETELVWLLWSGRKFREENKIGPADLQNPKNHAALSRSIRYLEANVDERRTLARIAIPTDPGNSFRQRVLRLVGGLNIADLEGLRNIMNEHLPLKKRPTGSPRNFPFVAR